MFKFLRILEEIDSPINGKIQVVKTLEGVRILAGGISQSGWLLKKVWGTALQNIKKERPETKDVLILGLGGGSAAELVAQFWPAAKITGVDADPLMINLGEKYLGLGEIPNLEIKQVDAQEFVKKQNSKNKFDLVLVDLYQGAKIPAQFKNDKFIKSVKGITKSDGICAFNYCLSTQEQEEMAQYERKIRKVFPVIRKVSPEANIIFVCFK